MKDRGDSELQHFCIITTDSLLPKVFFKMLNKSATSLSTQSINIHLPVQQFQSAASQHELRGLFRNCDTVIIFAVMFEISPGAVITQSELHYVIPGAKAFKVIILPNDMYSCFLIF